MNIIIFGPPLAGKGTQGKKIIRDFGLIHLSTGDALRAEKAAGTKLGLEAEAYSKKGLLAPDNLVSQVVESFYKKHDKQQGFLFDGYPRNEQQAVHLLELVAQQQQQIDQVIYLKVAENILFERAEERAKKQNRKDDKDPTIVLKRIQEFKTLTIPAIQKIAASGIPILEIDGGGDLDQIYQKIHTQITSLGKRLTQGNSNL